MAQNSHKTTRPYIWMSPNVGAGCFGVNGGDWKCKSHNKKLQLGFEQNLNNFTYVSMN